MPDRSPLDADAVDLPAPCTSLTVRDVVSSTNAELLGGTPGAVLVAEYQEAGRGRLERTWSSPPGAGLTFSVRVAPDLPAAARTWLPLLAGLAVADAVPTSSLKWPNDVLVGGRKLGGILAQSDGDGVVIGIGINVSTRQDELPVVSATSLQLEGLPVDRAALLSAVLAAFAGRYLTWVAAGGDAEACGLADAYRARCSTIGQQVRVTGATDLTGLASEVDREGRLVVDGVPVAAGDVEHVRPHTQ